MKQETISITATLKTFLTLRLFVLNYEAEVKHKNGDTDDHYQGDYLLDDNFDYSSHEEIMKEIKKVTKKEEGTGYLRNNYDLVIAYQILHTSKITDERSVHKHKDTSTEADGEMLTEKIFIFGTPIQKNEMKSLVDWVNTQRALESEFREQQEVWLQKGVSFYTPDGATKVMGKEAELFLKIGEATFDALTKKKNFKPYLS
jgi:uncharacterized membrane protein YkoI